MSRLPSLAFAVLFVVSGACDDESGPTDAGQDARRDGSSGCTMADCQGIQKPRVSCTPPTVPEFSCVRTYDQRCTWGQERCVPGPDGGTGADGSGADGTGADGSGAATDGPSDGPDDAPAG